MLWLVNQIVNLSWKFLGIAVVIALLRNGRETIIMAIKVGNARLQQWLFRKYKEQQQEENKES